MLKRVSIQQVKEAIEADRKPVLFDIRDPQSFTAAHIQDSHNLNNQNVHELTSRCQDDTPIIVICYHGHSSIGAAQFLINQGFEDVSSMDGGFEAWRLSYPYVGVSKA